MDGDVKLKIEQLRGKSQYMIVRVRKVHFPDVYFYNYAGHAMQEFHHGDVTELAKRLVDLGLANFAFPSQFCSVIAWQSTAAYILLCAWHEDFLLSGNAQACRVIVQQHEGGPCTSDLSVSRN